MSAACSHLDTVVHREGRPTDAVCPPCVELGDRWVHLRRCTECGRIGCCDSSKNRHATAHFRETGHPVIRSIEPGEVWLWCYVDEVAVELPAD